jgi:DnaK suppressor protein
MKTKNPSGPADPSVSAAQTWQWHRRALVRSREQLLRQSRDHFAQAANLQKADDPDFASLGGEEAEFEALVAELKAEEGLLEEVDAALDRLNRGVYGICEATGKPIEPERLRALPWTRFTRDAAAQRERPRR